MLGNIRTYLEQEGEAGDYQWEYMDGLADVPADVEAKFKKAIIEGKISDEDFKGVSSECGFRKSYANLRRILNTIDLAKLVFVEELQGRRPRLMKR